jgi:hypothetical protein
LLLFTCYTRSSVNSVFMQNRFPCLHNQPIYFFQPHASSKYMCCNRYFVYGYLFTDLSSTDVRKGTQSAARLVAKRMRGRFPVSYIIHCRLHSSVAA